MNQKLGLMLVTAAVALVILSMSVFVVDMRQRAIVFRFGEIVYVINKPGLYMKVPLVDNVRFFDARLLTIDSAEPERFLTKEKKNVLVDLFVKWQIADVQLYYISVNGDETRAAPIATLHTLRQQLDKREGRANAALSDFIAPAGSGVADYIGGFVVTAGIGEDVIADKFKAERDDYSSIMVKALADRLAEAFAERMHARVRREFWGYAPDEALSADDLILEKYQGIRPAPGYPAQPDHTEKATLFELLDAEASAGVQHDRDRSDGADVEGDLDHLGQRQPGLGHALIPAERAAGEIGGLEAGHHRHLRHDRVERAGRDGELGLGDQVFQLFHGTSSGHARPCARHP